MFTKEGLMEWLSSLDDDALIGINDGGLCLETDDGSAWLEVGGLCGDDDEVTA